MEELDKYLEQGESNESTLDEMITNNGVTEVDLTPSASEKNMAAYLSLMTTSPDKFEEVMLEMLDKDEYGSTPNLSGAMDMLRGETDSYYMESGVEVVQDPEVDEVTKQSVVQNLSLLPKQNFDYMTEFGIRTLAAPSKGETPAQAEWRINLADEIDKIVEGQKEIQAVLNLSAASNNADTANALIDFVEYVAPFTEGIQVANIRKQFIEDSSSLFSFIFRGSAKKEIVDAINSMPIEQRVEAVRLLAPLIKDKTNITSFNENDFAKTDLLRSFAEDGYYTGVDVAIDNVTGILDVIGLGKLASVSARTIARAFKKETISSVQAVSPSQVAKHTNPEAAKEMHKAVDRSETDDVAQALYGTTRDEALTHDLAPSALDDVVEARVLLDEVSSSVRFTSDEIEQATAQTKTNFENVTDVQVRDVQVGHEGGGLRVKASYGPPQGGWNSPQDALELTALALRNQGVTVDQLTLMVREGDKYVPTTLKEIEGRKIISQMSTNTQRGPGKGRKRFQTVVKRPDDYYVSIDTNKDLSLTDVTDPKRWQTKGLLNYFDRIPSLVTQTQGSVSRMLFNPDSLLPRFISGPALLAKDRTALLEERLLNNFKPFTETYTGLPAERQLKIEQYLKEANHKGFWDDSTTLKGKGFTDSEVEALQNWRRGWDVSYALENADLRKTLKNAGYFVLENSKTDTKLFAKPVPRNQASGGTVAYDATTDSYREFSSSQLTELYENGGQLASLRRPMQVDGETISYVVSSNTKDDYLRALNDTDTVLNYREGYYTVKYDAPWFIDQKIRSEKGEELYTKAVAVAGSRKEAELWMRNSGLDPEDLQMRNDKNGFDIDSDSYWDLQQSIGRTAQKHRGQRLQDSDNLSHLGSDHQYVKDPIDSVLDNARSLANRTAMRDTIDTMKQRFMNNYGHLLGGLPHTRKFPENAGQIGEKGIKTSAEAADARTLWEYIRYLENGYMDAIDETWKAGFNTMANSIGKFSSKGEKATRAISDFAPIRTARGLGFTTMIAWAPLRQLFIQSNQALQLMAIEPKYFGTKLGSEMSIISSIRLSEKYWDSAPGLKDAIEWHAKKIGMSLDEAVEMTRQFEKSGLSAAIDRSNLVREVMKSVSDYSALGNPNRFSNPLIRGVAKAAKLGAKGSQTVRKIGFDAGEEVVMTSAWLTFRNRALKANGGKPLTQRELDKVAVQARNFTGSMNAAGDMPYNQNSLKMLFQFFQVPHKMLLNVTTNKYLTAGEKAKLAGFNLAMYSLPVTAIYSLFGDFLGDLPEDQRDLIAHGLQGYALNKMTNMATDSSGMTDFSSLAPLDMYGTYSFLDEMLKGNFAEAISNSPSGSLFFGNNPRITNLLQEVNKFVGIQDDFETPTEFESVLKKTAELSSGMSAAFRANLAWKMGVRRSSLGSVVDSDMTKGEAFWLAFGFASEDEVLGYVTNQVGYEGSKKMKDDVKEFFNNFSKHYTSNVGDIESYEFVTKAYSQFNRVFKDFPQEYTREFQRLLSQRIKDRDVRLHDSVIRNSNVLVPEEWKKTIASNPALTEEQKQRLIQFQKDMDEMAREVEEQYRD